MNACPLCHSADVIVLPETHLDGNTRYQLHTCAVCEAHFWTPFKNPGAEWYRTDERYAGRNSDPILEPNEKHLKTISFFGQKHGRVLDIGCGVGTFCALAVQNGWDAYGIDFDPDAVEAGRRTFGLAQLEVNDLNGFAADHPGEMFDLVTFFDVFEHIDDHNDFIETAHASLRKGGHVALSVPYRGAWRWLVPHDLPPRHLTRWDEKSLSLFMERHGLAVEYVRLLPASLYFIVSKLRSRYGRAFTFGLVQKAKEHVSREGARTKRGTQTAKIRLLHALAKAKDITIFGLPALLIWLVLLPFKKRNTDMLVIAHRS